MKSIASDVFGWALALACLSLGIKFVLDRFSRRAADKREEAKRSELRLRREAREDKRPTLADASQTELDFHRRYTSSSDDTAESRSAIWAKLMLDDDLGRHAESPRPFDLDQSQRDTLLANARKDAAEALNNTRAMLREVRALSHSINVLARWITLALVIALLCYWWKSGFLPWGP